MRRIRNSEIDTRIETYGRRVRLVRVSDVRPFFAPQPDDWDDVIDSTLHIAFSAAQMLDSTLFPGSEMQLDSDDIYQGRLALDLRHLAAVARQETEDSPDAVDKRVNRILRALLGGAMVEDYGIPRTFWETGLGQLLSTARFRTYEPDELVTVGSAAATLHVTRPTIYRWMDDGHIRYVRDDVSGRTLLVAADVDELTKTQGPEW